MGVRGILVSFDEDASPNGAEGFQSWLKGMIDFHLPNMSVALTITDGPGPFGRRLTGMTAAQMWQANYPRAAVADRLWEDFKISGISPSGGKIRAIKEFRVLVGCGLKEAKDEIDAAAVRNP